jgi:hypothetical protein
MNTEQFNKLTDNNDNNNEAINFEPAFDFESDQKSILLQTDQTELRHGEQIIPCRSEARLDLQTSPSINFHLTSTDDEGSILGAFNFIYSGTTLCINNKLIEGFIVSCSSDSRKFSAKWSPQKEPLTVIGDDNTSIDNVVFHLFNFPDFKWQPMRISHKNGYIDWTELYNDTWHVCIKSLPATHDNINKIDNAGGYRLTHIGRVRKINNEPITGKEASDFLHSLIFFLSFVCGTCVIPVCPVGFNANGEKQWEQWSAPYPNWGKTAFMWSHECGTTQMTSLFHLFQQKWRSDHWERTLHDVIYWYLRANNISQGVDTGIILAQTALERLAYEYIVNDKCSLSREDFKKLSASNKYRTLFSTLGIPLNIPQATPMLQKLANQLKQNLEDAPHALTEIRNSLVHPVHKYRRDQFDDVYFEAWKLSLWYLELSILAICGYNDVYCSRLQNNTFARLEKVPWS